MARGTVRAREVWMSPRIASPDRVAASDELIVHLFDGIVLTAAVDRVTSSVLGATSVRGRVVGTDYGYVLISSTDGQSMGSIDVPDRGLRYAIQYDSADRTHYLLDLTGAELDEIMPGPPVLPPPEAQVFQDPGEDPQAPPALGQGVNDPAVVDVMVVYTPAARDWAGGSAGIANVIAQAMERAQLANDNSQTLITKRLVHSAEVSYTESGDSSMDLSRLRNPSDGHMDEVHTWRDQYGADLVALFTRVDDTGGIGYLLNDKNGLPSYGFSITRVQQASWTYTHVHEMGHNMGCHHHKQQNTQPGPTVWGNWTENTWSAGWRWVGNDDVRYCSIMTYENGAYFPDGQTHSRVAHFACPNIQYQGVPTGHAADGDNARTLREIKHVVAAYRAATTLDFVISGHVTNAAGVGIGDVTMQGLPGNPTTASSGFYSAEVGYGWSGTVTPQTTGWAFDPPSRQYVSVSGDLDDQDYAGYPVDMAVATYSGGDISTDIGFQSLPGASGCPGTLTVTIPVGAAITGVDVAYAMTARNVGWMSEQRSWLRCVSPGGMGESQMALGTGSAEGTYSYLRTGLDIANGVAAGGDIVFELHAGRTWGGSGCNTTYNKVDNNTWTVTVHYAPPSQRTLQVFSAFGNAAPAVGVHHYDDGATVTCSVVSPAAVSDSHSNVTAICTGWTGTGSVPESGGGTNTGPFTITADSTVAWQWLVTDIAASNQIVTGAATLEARDTITAGNGYTIEDSANVIFRVGPGGSISLGPLFEARTGSVFEALIDTAP